MYKATASWYCISCGNWKWLLKRNRKVGQMQPIWRNRNKLIIWFYWYLFSYFIAVDSPVLDLPWQWDDHCFSRVPQDAILCPQLPPGDNTEKYILLFTVADCIKRNDSLCSSPKISVSGLIGNHLESIIVQQQHKGDNTVQTAKSILKNLIDIYRGFIGCTYYSWGFVDLCLSECSSSCQEDVDGNQYRNFHLQQIS